MAVCFHCRSFLLSVIRGSAPSAVLSPALLEVVSSQLPTLPVSQLIRQPVYCLISQSDAMIDSNRTDSSRNLYIYRNTKSQPSHGLLDASVH